MKLLVIVLLTLGTGIFGQSNPFLSPSRTDVPPTNSIESLPQVQFPGEWEDEQMSVVNSGNTSDNRSIGEMLLSWQIGLNREIGQRITDVREGKSPWLLFALMGITFLYGIIHTLGPGHRKTVLIGWILNSKPRFSSIVSTSILLGLFHTLGTGIIMLIAVFLRGIVGDSLLQSRNSVQQWANLFSGMVVFVLGIFLLKGSISHKHHHDCESCGNLNHDHTDESDHEPRGLDDRRTLLMVALSMGLVPCPGSLSVLAVSFLIGDVIVGLAAVLSISFGTISTLLVLGITVRYILYSADNLAQSNEKASKFIERTMQIIQVGSAVVVLVYGILWSLGGFLTVF